MEGRIRDGVQSTCVCGVLGWNKLDLGFDSNYSKENFEGAYSPCSNIVLCPAYLKLHVSTQKTCGSKPSFYVTLTKLPSALFFPSENFISHPLTAKRNTKNSQTSPSQLTFWDVDVCILTLFSPSSQSTSLPFPNKTPPLGIWGCFPLKPSNPQVSWGGSIASTRCLGRHLGWLEWCPSGGRSVVAETSWSWAVTWCLWWSWDLGLWYGWVPVDGSGI